MQNSEIHQVELSIEEAKGAIEKAERVRRLSVNADFKAIIDQGYLKDEAVRLTHLLSDPTAAEYREFIQRDLESIGGLQRYLRNLLNFGDIASREIEEHMETLDELQEEEDADEVLA